MEKKKLKKKRVMSTTAAAHLASPVWLEKDPTKERDRF
jgi:hypothetical protein